MAPETTENVLECTIEKFSNYGRMSKDDFVGSIFYLDGRSGEIQGFGLSESLLLQEPIVEHIGTDMLSVAFLRFGSGGASSIFVYRPDSRQMRSFTLLLGNLGSASGHCVDASNQQIQTEQPIV